MLTTFRTPFGRFCWRNSPLGWMSRRTYSQNGPDNGGSERSNWDQRWCLCLWWEQWGPWSAPYQLDGESTRRRIGIQFCKVPHQAKKYIILWNIYTDNGIIPDDDKVRDIQDLPTPENREDLHRFIGMMTYLSQFIPYFAEKAYTLRWLLKKDLSWMWDIDHQKSFDELKHAASTSTCL